MATITVPGNSSGSGANTTLLETNLNVSPYFDDFDPTKQYYKVLFKPGTAVQVRELNQLQSILQNQIASFGQNIFKEGSVIKGCSFTFDNDYSYVKLNDTYANTTALTVTDLQDLIVTNSRGLTATVINTLPGLVASNPALNTIYIKYNNSALYANGVSQKQFDPGETLTFTTAAGTSQGQVLVSSYSDAVGKGYAFTTTEGIIFKKGYFIYVAPQTAIISKYTNVPDNVSVGFKALESIISANYDDSLFDNAAGAPNYTAPGADRLRLEPYLVTRTTSDASDSTFFSLVDFKMGKPITIRNDTQFNSIAAEEAVRTYETNGNFVVKQFDLSSQSIANTSDEDYATHFNTIVSKGLGYVEGYRVEFINNNTVKMRRGTDKSTVSSQKVPISMGNYFYVNQVYGNFLNSSEIIKVELHKVAKTANSLRTASRNVNDIIGTAYVKGFNHYSGVQGFYDSKYKIYLFNVVMSPGKSMADVKSIIYYTSSVQAAADVVLTYNASTQSYFADLQNSTNETLFFPFGQNSITPDGFNNINFNYRKTFGSTFSSGSGSFATVTITSSGDVTYNDSFNFSSSNPNDLIVVPSTDAVTPVKSGTVTVYDNQQLKIAPTTDSDSVVNIGTINSAIKVWNDSATNSIGNVQARFRVNDPIYYYVPTGNVAIGGLTGNTWYFVSFANDTHISLSTSQGLGSVGGANITLTETRSTLASTATGWGHNFSGNASVGYVYNGSVSPSFYSNYVIGDFINISSADTRQITNILSDNTIVVNQAFTNDRTNASHKKIFPANIPIPFDVYGRSISYGTNIRELKLYLNENIASGFAVTVDASVNRSNASSIKKAINKSVYVKIDCALHTNKNTGPWCLGMPDVLGITGVYVDQTGSGYSETGTNYVKNFVLDNGQRDSLYDLAYIKLNNGPSGTPFALQKNAKLLVKFSTFTVQPSEGVGFFTANSYPINDANYNATTTITTLEIPRYTTSKGVSYDLRDVLDFRPLVGNTANVATTSQYANINPSYSLSFPSTPYLPQPESLFTTNISNYLGRVDRVSLDINGNIVVREGQPALNNPIPPQEPAKNMTLALVNIPPFPSLTLNEAKAANSYTNMITSKLQQQVRFTMADIGKFNNRLKNLEYYTSLSVLEQSAASLQVRSTDTGQTRFQNGIFVDGFNGFDLSNTKDPTYYIGIDANRTELRPATFIMRSEFNVDLDASSSNVVQAGNLIMLKHTNDNLYIKQEYASKYYNCIEGNIFHNKGVIKLTPSTATGPDIINKPIVNSIDEASNWINLAKAWGTQWNSWETSAASTVRDTLIKGTDSESETVAAGDTSKVTGKTAVNGGTDTTTTTQTLQQTTSTMKLIGTTLSAVAGKPITSDLGTFLSSVTITPFIPSTTIFFQATGLKPSTRVYPYFDNVPVSAFCAPASQKNDYTTNTTDLKSLWVNSSGNQPVLGTTLITDSNGGVSGIFTIPKETFHSGELVFKLVDIDNLETGVSSITTEAEATFYGRTLSKASTQSILSTLPAVVNSQEVKSDNIVINGFAVSTDVVKTFIANPPPAASGGGGGCGCGCFTSSSLIMLASGKEIPINEVKIGDLVYNKNKTAINEVKFVEIVNDKYFKNLYSPNETLEPFATLNHPLFIDGELSSVNPDNNLNWYPWLGKNKKIEAILAPTTGQKVYNLWVDGDGTYVVNGFGTTSIIGDGGLLRLGIEQGIITMQEATDIMLYYTEKSKAAAYGSYIMNKVFAKMNIKWLNKFVLNSLKGQGYAKKFFDATFVLTGKVAS
jgi:hypothetical protein